MSKTGNYGGHVGKLIALHTPKRIGEKVIVHHYTDLGDKVQIEVERRFNGSVTFSRDAIRVDE